jgi:hypothetical protein
MRQVQVVAIRDGDAVLAREYSLIAFEEHWFCFGVFLLSGEAGAKEAFSAESLPVIRLVLLICLHCLARQGLGVGELTLRRVRQSYVPGGRGEYSVVDICARRSFPPLIRVQL